MDTIKEMLEIYNKTTPIREAMIEKNFEMEHVDMLMQFNQNAVKIDQLRDLEVEAFTAKKTELETEVNALKETNRNLLMRLDDMHTQNNPNKYKPADKDADPELIFKSFCDNIT